MPEPIPYARQSIDASDVAAVVAVMYSDFVTQGPAVEAFEAAVAAYVGAPHAVAVTNATAALIVGCRAFGIGPDSRVWTSPNSFVASSNCALLCGATVDFVDIEYGTWNMSVTALAEKLELAARAGTLPDLVIPVHFAGQSCDMAAVGALARQYGFRVLEDASHAIGSSDGADRTGACAHSDAVVFSFHPVKIITTGEGGMLVTRDAGIAERARLFRSHGVTRDEHRLLDIADGPWYYEQLELGYNLRLTDIQAALGTSQLKRIDAFVERRRAIAGAYATLLADTGLTLPVERPGARSSYHLYAVHTSGNEASVRRRALYDVLVARGIRPSVHYRPIHLQPYYRALGFKPGDFPQAEAYYAGALSLPMYVDLSDADQRRVAQAIHEVGSAV